MQVCFYFILVFMWEVTHTSNCFLLFIRLHFTGLRLCMIDRKADVNLRKEEIPSLITLIRDPYISFTACK